MTRISVNNAMQETGARNKEGEKKETSRPKAKDGLRYPSPAPAQWFVKGSILYKQGFGSTGERNPVELGGICASVRPLPLEAGIGLLEGL